MVSRGDVYDHILGSGATMYSWYWDVTNCRPPLTADDDWHITLLMDDPEDTDETIPVDLDYDEILDMAQNICNDSGVGRHGESENYKVGQDCRRQCELLLNDPDEVDFDADTADQVIQCIAYGEVVFG